MRTCRFLAEENLFLRRCITSCGSTEPTDYTPDICQAIPRRMAVSACQNITQLRYSIQSVSELQSLCSAERRSVVIGANRNLHFCDETIDLPTHALAHVLIRALLRPRNSGDGGEIITASLLAQRFVLAVFGPRERSTRSDRIFNVSSRSGSIAGSLVSSPTPAPATRSVSASGAASGSTFGDTPFFFASASFPGYMINCRFGLSTVSSVRR